MLKKLSFLTLILGILFGFNALLTAKEDAEDQNKKMMQIQLKAQKAISQAVMQCTIDNGSDYTKLPYQRKLINAKKNITVEDEMEMDGAVLLSLKGAINFKNYSDGNFTIKGSLNYVMNFIDGSTSHFKAKYTGTLDWIVNDTLKYEVTAVYDYTLESEKNVNKIKGTVTIGDKVYEFNENGTIKLK
ncbi:MAG TPA: hypothetical protein DHW82_10835 [Spirochaetia bacterium]|nr:MAG: hypothetical protein A2Y41_09615 [Spirochaetes bacterium GWB1_36_13]HCL57488.1 hypothetical protein [Spirochaetia bacterium]